MEQEFELTSQLKSLHNMESYDALKQVDPRSAADARVQETTKHGLKITSN